jgi:GTPase SAR1 family protein
MSESSADRDTPHPEIDLRPALHRIAELAAQFRSDRVSDAAIALAARIAEGRIYVACVGQFKRGKSTLLDALVGERILPTGVVPVTMVPTVLRYGSSKCGRVRFRGESWKEISLEDIPQFVSEEQNPQNAKGVVGVEVFCPGGLLSRDLSFVDTPGLGSIFASNTAATQAFIPHIDAAIVVLGADPPISGEELALVETISKHVRDILVVLNKADKTTDSERGAAEAFTRHVLEERLNRPIGRIYQVSAEERLENRGPIRDWGDLLDALQTLERDSHGRLIRAAGKRGFRRLSEELLTILAEEKSALLRPIEESERRIQKLRTAISDAERSLRSIGYLFMAEQRHLSDMFLDRRQHFLAETNPVAHSELEQMLQRIPRSYGPRFRREIMSAAQEIARRRVLPWLEHEQTRAETEYRHVEARFVNIANNFLKDLSQSNIPELAQMPNALDTDKGFRVPSEFRFQELIHIAQPASPLRYLADLFVGASRCFYLIERNAREFLDHLLEMNSARVQSDIRDRVQESRNRLELEIRKLLHEISRIAETALERARITRSAGVSAVQSAIARIESAEREIRNLRLSLN